MTKTHRIKSDPFRHILLHPDEGAVGAPLRRGFQFPHDERLVEALKRSWWVADPRT